ncbi:DUF262 domain-containing protein [Kurthia sp. ISK08]|uniref:DUF262 domain-containing protein n=1 Tax=Kurthia sp. ISK08 TaxID=3385835 RepID=UPI0038FC5928
MTLQNEIDQKVKEIHTDGYPMSLGELINMYRDGELYLQPDFQRFFRWNDTQKTRFIESILLGIPIPSIFVARGESGIWDVIDGLQRLSTILEFVGILKGKDGETLSPLALQGTKFLPSLKGKKWEDKYDLENSFTPEQRIDFKRSKLDVKIIKKGSDEEAKFELFQRLNTGGSSLTNQEIRNCLMIMSNKDFYEWLFSLSQNSDFQDTLPLTDKQLIEREDIEIALRFFVYRHLDVSILSGSEDMGEFLTNSMLDILKSDDFDLENEAMIFKKTFSLLNNILGENSFKKFDATKNKFLGAFLVSSFEMISIGISKNLDFYLEMDEEELIKKIKDLYQNPVYLDTTKRSGIRAINRLKILSSLSETEFSV